MQSIGERLEEARKRKGASIREAAEATKIRGDYLTKFESNQFDIGLPEIYVRGFLRIYSSYVKLGPEKIVGDYNALPSEAHPKGARRPEAAREVLGRMNAPQGSTPPEVPPAAVSAPPHKAAFDSPAQQRDNTMMLKIGVIAMSAIAVFAVIVFAVRAIISEPNTPAASAEAAMPESITLVAVDNVRVKVVQKADGMELFQGTLARGETKTLPKTGPIYITADYGQNLQIQYRGQRVDTGFQGYGRSMLQ